MDKLLNITDEKKIKILKLIALILSIVALASAAINLLKDTFSYINLFSTLIDYGEYFEFNHILVMFLNAFAVSFSYFAILISAALIFFYAMKLSKSEKGFKAIAWIFGIDAFLNIFVYSVLPIILGLFTGNWYNYIASSIAELFGWSYSSAEILNIIGVVLNFFIKVILGCVSAFAFLMAIKNSSKKLIYIIAAIVPIFSMLCSWAINGLNALIQLFDGAFSIKLFFSLFPNLGFAAIWIAVIIFCIIRPMDNKKTLEEAEKEELELSSDLSQSSTIDEPQIAQSQNAQFKEAQTNFNQSSSQKSQYSQDEQTQNSQYHQSMQEEPKIAPEKELQILREKYDSGIITAGEYIAMREEVLKKM